jgi:hypothetical protein
VRGIDPHGTPRRDERRGGRDEREHHRHRDVRDRIRGAHAEQLCLEHRRQRQRDAGSDEDPCGGKPNRLPDHERQYLPGSRAEREANADFDRALRRDEGDPRLVRFGVRFQF